MGAIVLVVGVISFGAVTAAVTILVVTRSRRRSENGRPVTGTYSQNMGYPPQQAGYPHVQGTYPTPAPDQGYGYPAPPAQPPQHPNPYAQ